MSRWKPRNPARALFREVSPRIVLILDKPMSMTDVSRKLGITWKTGSDLLHQLNEQGIVLIANKDKKSKVVSLTEKGLLLKDCFTEMLILMGAKSENLSFVPSNVLQD